MVLMVASTACSLHLLRIDFSLESVSVVSIQLDLLVAPKVLASWNLVLATDGSFGSQTWQSMQVLSWLHLFPWLWYVVLCCCRVLS
jgi:hypothetical protein